MMPEGRSPPAEGGVVRRARRAKVLFRGMTANCRRRLGPIAICLAHPRWSPTERWQQETASAELEAGGSGGGTCLGRDGAFRTIIVEVADTDELKGEERMAWDRSSAVPTGRGHRDGRGRPCGWPSSRRMPASGAFPRRTSDGRRGIAEQAADPAT